MSCVNSSANTTDMMGARIMPPSVAAMNTSGQIAGCPPGIQGPSSAPRQAPSISNGASTPPEVPEPSASTHIAALQTSNASTAPRAMWPSSRSPITS